MIEPSDTTKELDMMPQHAALRAATINILHYRPEVSAGVMMISVMPLSTVRHHADPPEPLGVTIFMNTI